MNLTPRAIDKLYVHHVAALAHRRRDPGTKLVSCHDPVGV